MTFRGRYRTPSKYAWQMAQAVDLDDACVECGYQFAYDQEGCDACKPITDLLAIAGQTRQEET